MATILSSKKSSGGSPYCYYTVSASLSSRTATTVTFKFTISCKLQYSSSYIGTGKTLTAGIYFGGKWNTKTLKSSSAVWSGTSAHTCTITASASVSASTKSASVYFRSVRGGSGDACELGSTKCSSVTFTAVTSSFGSIKMTGSATNQKQATATVSGMPKVTYATSIRWYLGSTHKKTTSRSASTSTSSYSYTYTGLLPNTSYTLKATAYAGSTAISTKTVTITTPQETGAISVTPYSTYLKTTVSSMFNGPNYTRKIEIYYKKSSESTYKLFNTLTGQGTSVSANITGLISNVSYDVKAIIKNGTIALKTLISTGNVTTKDTSLIPCPEIEDIVQRLGTRECTLTWFANKSVAGTVYTIQAKSAEDTTWVNLKTLTDIESPIKVISHTGNTDVTFRISAINEKVASGTINYSEEYGFYVRDDFVWDIEKVQGNPLVITANEWNRLAEYVVARNRDIGKEIIIPSVNSKDLIYAETYNVMKNAISQVNYIDIPDKMRGDAISAIDIDTLRIAINKTSA